MRRCPETGTNCFDPGCATGCQGYDIHVEAITVIHTTIRRRAAVSLVYGGGARGDDAARPAARGTCCGAKIPCGDCPITPADIIAHIAALASAVED